MSQYLVFSASLSVLSDLQNLVVEFKLGDGSQQQRWGGCVWMHFSSFLMHLNFVSNLAESHLHATIVGIQCILISVEWSAKLAIIFTVSLCLFHAIPSRYNEHQIFCSSLASICEMRQEAPPDYNEPQEAEKQGRCKEKGNQESW
jgi:hypothetical protein